MMNKPTVEIDVILNSEFNNYNLIEANRNIQDVISKTKTVEVTKVNYIVAEKDGGKFSFEDSDNIVALSLNNIQDVFNSRKLNRTCDYVAFYSANTLWVSNHLDESINTLKSNKKSSWNVTVAELNNSLTMTEKTVLHYRNVNFGNPFLNDIIIGEIVIKSSELSKVDFNRGIVKDEFGETFAIGYCLNQTLGKPSENKMATVRYYMTNNNNNNNLVDYMPIEKEYDFSKLESNKIYFSVLVNVTNLKNTFKLADILSSLKTQKFPLSNVEVIFVTNYNSNFIFINKDEIDTEIPNNKILYIGGQQTDEFGNMDYSVYNIGIQHANGEVITYLNINEGFTYDKFYLSELYENYKDDNVKWTYSNYFNTFNYMDIHSNIKIPSRDDLFMTLFSNRKIQIPYLFHKSWDKYFLNKNLMLLNFTNVLQSQQIQGLIISKNLIRKVM